MQRELVYAAGWTGVGLQDATGDLSCLDGSGRWFVVAPFDGPPIALQMERWRPAKPMPTNWRAVTGWHSHTERADYLAAVEHVRNAIAAGDVYQVNVCRLMSAPTTGPVDISGLWGALAAGNPAPHAALVDIEHPLLAKLGRDRLQIASASPELFLSRDGRRITSAPIKGTAQPGADFLEKDRAENIMIVDLVRNDLSVVCVPGSVEVAYLLERQAHPGLDHLVSTVAGELMPDATWPQLMAAAFPPGSVSGAPKSAALRLIAELEQPRDIYCGALGIVDADAQTASLNVAIRTFWQAEDRLWFGTGAGITWGSDPVAEWEETELKAHRLVGIASTDWSPR